MEGLEGYQEEVLKISNKISAEIVRNGDFIPYISVNGKYVINDLYNLSWWTNGFWGGINWQLYHYTGEEKFRVQAEQLEEKLNFNLEEFVHLHHDVGFMWLLTSGLNYKLTGNSQAYERMIHVANILAARFNINGNFIRAWNDEQTGENCVGWTIIDSMMNIPLLYWCAETLHDPRFSSIASAHAKTVAKYLVREDGSVNHIGVFNPSTGEFLENNAGQGFSANSSWSRGQAWAIYGFAICYRYTKDDLFLSTAKKVANYVLAHATPATENSALAKIAPIDYYAPPTADDKDASASAITACGLLELAEVLNSAESEFYQQKGLEILASLAGIADYNPESDGIIGHCAVQYHGEKNKNVSLVYADYFYLEGLLKVLSQNVNAW